MKGKTKLRIIQILCIVSLLITVFSIQRTYARYFEKVDTTYETNIKRWLVNVNESFIRENTTLNEIMEPVLVSNPHMNNNDTLVPGREGYFEFLIDYNSIDLAFKFEFTLEQLNTEPLQDFEVYGYEVVDPVDETANVITETTDISQIIDPTTEVDSNGEKKRLIRVLFRWNDYEDNLMDNLADTAFVGEDYQINEDGELSPHKIIKYNAKITFTQYIPPADEGQS